MLWLDSCERLPVSSGYQIGQTCTVSSGELHTRTYIATRKEKDAIHSQIPMANPRQYQPSRNSAAMHSLIHHSAWCCETVAVAVV